MLTDLKKHKPDYSLMAIIAAVFTLTFLAKRNEPRYLMILTVFFSAAYVLWGIWHHLRLRDLSARLVLEYLLVAAFALVVVGTLLI